MKTSSLRERDDLAALHRQEMEPTHLARLGQVMTPSDVAYYMADLLQPESRSRLLDPAAGLGILAHAALDCDNGPSGSGVTLVELDENCLETLRRDPTFRATTIVGANFVDWAFEQIRSGKRWDRIIANPPYLNFHDFNRDIIDQVNRFLRIKLTKFTNLYALFLLLCSRLLDNGGRMVFITPTELFTTNYGKLTLNSLVHDARLRELTIFEPEAEPFAEVDTSACVTMFDKSQESAVIIKRVLTRGNGHQSWKFGEPISLPLEDILARPKDAFQTAPPLPELPEDLQCRLGDLVRVSRGIATGANAFFALDANARGKVDPEGTHTVPVLTKAEHIGDELILTPETLARLEADGKRCWLLYLSGDEPLSATLSEYIEEGARREISNRYLCRYRRPWYSMEPQAPPEAFIQVFSRSGTKVAVNQAGMRTLACFHRIYHHSPRRLSQDELLLLGCFLKSIIGNRAVEAEFRRYGSGLQKLEPKDVERIRVPDLRRLPAETTAALSRLLLEHLQKGTIATSICDAISSQLLAALRTSPPQIEVRTRLKG